MGAESNCEDSQIPSFGVIYVQLWVLSIILRLVFQDIEVLMRDKAWVFKQLNPIFWVCFSSGELIN